MNEIYVQRLHNFHGGRKGKLCSSSCLANVEQVLIDTGLARAPFCLQFRFTGRHIGWESPMRPFSVYINYTFFHPRGRVVLLYKAKSENAESQGCHWTVCGVESPCNWASILPPTSRNLSGFFGTIFLQSSNWNQFPCTFLGRLQM